MSMSWAALVDSAFWLYWNLAVFNKLFKKSTYSNTRICSIVGKSLCYLASDLDSISRGGLKPADLPSSSRY